MSIPCNKNFPLVPNSRSPVKFSYSSHTRVKIVTLSFDITFEWHEIGPTYLTCELIVTGPFFLLQVQGHQSRLVFKVIFMHNANFNIGHNF